jgi:nucleoside-diphosphate-sugar epimerase
MAMTVILGATGPTGFHLAAELRKAGTPVRVVARDRAKLGRLFPDPAIDKHPADVLDANQTLRAIDGCDLVYDCIGLPGDRMHLHPVTAQNIAEALARIKARCVQVSSYWSYYPQAHAEMNEAHPRRGGPPWVVWRRDAEDILFAAGAAILHLPDFYGPHAHVSTLQNALLEAAEGKTVNWIGKPITPREYVYVPDAMRIAAEIGRKSEAFGAHWGLPGSGPVSGRGVADIAGRYLNRQVKVRGAGMMTLRMVSLFNKELRGFMQVVPDYMKPVRYDASKLMALLGPQQMTPYEAGIGATLDWLAGHARPTAA